MKIYSYKLYLHYNENADTYTFRLNKSNLLLNFKKSPSKLQFMFKWLSIYVHVCGDQSVFILLLRKLILNNIKNKTKSIQSMYFYFSLYLTGHIICFPTHTFETTLVSLNCLGASTGGLNSFTNSPRDLLNNFTLKTNGDPSSLLSTSIKIFPEK